MSEGIQIAEVWSILGNETVGTLTLVFHDDGRVTGGVYNNNIEGFWDKDAQKLTFIRIPNGKQPNAHQIFTGYKFSWKDKSGTDVDCLAGSFEAFAGTAASAGRNVFGWYALRTGTTLAPGDPPSTRLWQDAEHNFPTGGESADPYYYNVLANGYLDKFSFPKNPAGSVDGGKFHGDEITGFLNDAAGRISFIRVPSPNVANRYQVYTGYHVKADLVQSVLTGWAGSFEAFEGTGATAERIIYGWYALTRYYVPH